MQGAFTLSKAPLSFNKKVISPCYALHVSTNFNVPIELILTKWNILYQNFTIAIS